MSGWGVFGTDSPGKSSSASGRASSNQKAQPPAGRSRDPAAAAMAASLGLDVSAFDMPDDAHDEMAHENLIDGP